MIVFYGSAILLGALFAGLAVHALYEAFKTFHEGGKNMTSVKRRR